MPRKTFRNRSSLCMGITLALATIFMLTGCGGSIQAGRMNMTGSGCASPYDGDGAWRHGCATQRNLAALAANPEDLYTPHPEGPRDAVRRDTVIGNYGRNRSASSQAATGAATPASGTGNTQ